MVLLTGLATTWVSLPYNDYNVDVRLAGRVVPLVNIVRTESHRSDRGWSLCAELSSHGLSSER